MPKVEGGFYIYVVGLAKENKEVISLDTQKIRNQIKQTCMKF